MENIDTDPRFRAALARQRGFMSASPAPGDASKPPRGLRLQLFVNSPLARGRIATNLPAARRTPADLVPASESQNMENTLPAVAAGEPRAMNRCIARHGGIIWAIVKRYVKDTTEAEDLVQDIFTEVWKKAASFDPAIASESTFVGMIARRRAIDSLRRQGRQPGFDTLDAAKSLAHNPWETSSATRDPEAVKSSLASLPSDTRELFHLFFENGFTHPEIAEKTGLPLGTIKTRLRRGLITLRELLQRPGNSNQPTAS